MNAPDHVKAVQRAKCTPGAECEREGRSLRRFLEVEDLLEQRAKWSHDRCDYITGLGGNVRNWRRATDAAARSAAPSEGRPWQP